MSESLTVARRLSALDDDALSALLSSRQVAAREARDFFDLADLLLSPASVRAALRTIDRSTLEALASGDPIPDAKRTRALTRLGLLVPDDGVPTGVREQAAEVLAAHPLPTHPLATVADENAEPALPLRTAEPSKPSTPTHPGHPATDAASALAVERAFTAISAVAEIGHQLRLGPGRIRAHGGLSAHDEKRLAAVLGLDPGTVHPLLELARAAGLVQIDDDAVFSTTLAEPWGLRSPGARWFALASAWLRSLPTPVRRTLAGGSGRGRTGKTGEISTAGTADGSWLSGERLQRAFTELYPAADAVMLDTLPPVDAVAAVLGLAVDGAPTVFGEILLRAPRSPGALDPSELARLEELLPGEVDRVYLQDDLTIIAPGPLAPPVDARIRSLADLENRGVASSYRVSRPSIDRALALGENEAGLREFLTGISLTGVPQALDYLLTEGARRHGLVRVGPARLDTPSGHPRPASSAPGSSAPGGSAPGGSAPGGSGSGAGTRIRSADATLLATLAVDQSLGALGIRRDEAGGLTSRVDAVAAYWLLLDAGYPVLAVDAAGEPRMLRRARILDRREAPLPPSGEPPITPAVVELVARLRQASVEAGDDDAAWVGRELGKAVRARTPVVIEVRLADGSTTRLEVTPLSFANGRLRCVDVHAGVERTVPVANILSVTTA